MRSVQVSVVEAEFASLLVDDACTPGVPLAHLVKVLDDVDPRWLDPVARVTYLQAAERAERRAAALKVRAMTAIADSYEQAGKPAMDARFEIGAALKLSPVTASDRTQVALALRDQF